MLTKIQYQKHQVCGNFKVISLLLDQQLGYTTFVLALYMSGTLEQSPVIVLGRNDPLGNGRLDLKHKEE